MTKEELTDTVELGDFYRLRMQSTMKFVSRPVTGKERTHFWAIDHDGQATEQKFTLNSRDRIIMFSFRNLQQATRDTVGFIKTL